jgi:hypothetical protein
MEDLINNCQQLFDENQGHRSPPLPPTPVGEPVPAFTYGTSHTKVTTVPPAALSTNAKRSSEDFTPPLPPRPANSIHPSLRANTSTPTKERKDFASTLSSLPEPQTVNGMKSSSPLTIITTPLGGDIESFMTYTSPNTTDTQTTPVSLQATLPPSPKTTASSVQLETTPVNPANTDKGEPQALPDISTPEKPMRQP